jgi:hypothetical protein
MIILSTDPRTVDGRSDGERRRDAAHDLHRRYRDTLIRRAQRVLLRTLLERGTATADDVRAGIDLPAGVDPVCLGAVPTPLARAGIIRRLGYAETTRPCAHARPVSVWELVDRAAAEAWLIAHPDVPPPETTAAPAHHGQRVIEWGA